MVRKPNDNPREFQGGRVNQGRKLKQPDSIKKQPKRTPGLHLEPEQLRCFEQLAFLSSTLFGYDELSRSNNDRVDFVKTRKGPALRVRLETYGPWGREDPKEDRHQEEVAKREAGLETMDLKATVDPKGIELDGKGRRYLCTTFTVNAQDIVDVIASPQALLLRQKIAGHPARKHLADSGSRDPYSPYLVPIVKLEGDCTRAIHNLGKGAPTGEHKVKARPGLPCVRHAERVVEEPPPDSSTAAGCGRYRHARNRKRE